jgi:hypothetical protein
MVFTLHPEGPDLDPNKPVDFKDHYGDPLPSTPFKHESSKGLFARLKELEDIGDQEKINEILDILGRDGYVKIDPNKN